MVTKNSAEEEKSPIKESFSRRFPSQVGASKFTWCNLENIPKSSRWSTEIENHYLNKDTLIFAVSLSHSWCAWISCLNNWPRKQSRGLCSSGLLIHVRLLLGETQNLHTCFHQTFNQSERKVAVPVVWYNSPALGLCHGNNWKRVTQEVIWVLNSYSQGKREQVLYSLSLAWDTYFWNLKTCVKQFNAQLPVAVGPWGCELYRAFYAEGF